MGQAYARYRDVGVALIDKRRPAHNRAEVVHMVGHLKDRHVIIIDDMIDTAGTLLSASQSAMEHGAKSITAVATHGLFSEPARQSLLSAPIDKIIVTNTITIDPRELNSKLEIISVAKVFAASIERITAGQSLRSLVAMEV